MQDIGGGAIAQINAYIRQDNWNLTLVTQPTQSPDLNMMDLGLFNGMKAKADGVMIVDP